MVNALVVDTSALLAYFDASEPDHESVSRSIHAEVGLLVVSAYVIAELDYLVATRHGVERQLAVLDELRSGAWELASVAPSDLARARDIIATYADQQIGVADASNVVLAERYGTRSVATLDRRHFTVLRTIDGAPLIVVPDPST